MWRVQALNDCSAIAEKFKENIVIFWIAMKLT